MISFSSAVGNIFPILGKCAALIKNLRSYQSTQQTSLINLTTGLLPQLVNYPDIQAVVGGSYMSILNGVGFTGTFAAQIASQSLNRAVFNDNPQAGQTAISGSDLVNLRELIRQMKLAGASVLAMPITATPTTFTGTGNGVIVASTKRALDGLVMENSYSEGMQVQCTSDSYSGATAAGNEGFSITGDGLISNPFDYTWPGGSGCSVQNSAIDGNSSNSRGNIFTNTGFANWTGATPNNFIIDAGGSLFSKETSLIYDGSAALKILGDGATAAILRQPFNNSSTGTGGSLSPLMQYAFNVFVRRDGVAPGAGVITIDLVDGNGAVIADANGVNNSFTITCSSLTTSYVSYNVAFRTPAIMPSTYAWRIRLSTALTNGRAVYLAKAALGTISQCYVSGPSAAVFAGSVPFQAGDYATLTILNSRGSGGTLATFQTAFANLFSPTMIAYGLLLPSSATPTISDGSLIV